jgi:hypothetical protein
VLYLNGCDDGDLIQEDINFQDIATTSCTTIIFQTKEKKHYLDTQKFFVNEPSLTDAPTTIDINNSNRCLPLYNGIVSTNNICETIAPLAPQ